MVDIGESLTETEYRFVGRDQTRSFQTFRPLRSAYRLVSAPHSASHRQRQQRREIGNKKPQAPKLPFGPSANVAGLAPVTSPA